MITLDIAKIATIVLLVWHGIGLMITGISLDYPGGGSPWSFVRYLVGIALIIPVALRIFGVW